jgi:hypothetical protein
VRVLILLLILSGCVRAEPIAVIGDSLTSVEHSWANVIPRQMYIMAQPGRTIRDYDMPRDWVAVQYKYVIYFLGTNDIIGGISFFKVQRTFRQHIGFMQVRGFKPIVILPPVYPQAEQSSLVLRKMLASTCRNHNVPTIDLEGVWEPDWTFDGVHLTNYSHLLLAEYINEQLKVLI